MVHPPEPSTRPAQPGVPPPQETPEQALEQARARLASARDTLRQAQLRPVEEPAAVFRA